MHTAFLAVLQDEEEQHVRLENDVRLAAAIQESCKNYASWFYRSLTSVNGMAYCLEDHLYDKFDFSITREEEGQWMKLMSVFWPSDSRQFVQRKLGDKAEYNEDVARHFREKLKTTGKTGNISPPAASATDDCHHLVNST
jgi:hypothetical protein